MGAPYNPPKSGEDFVTYVRLKDMAVAGRYKVNPTLASGDFTVSIDDGNEAPLGTTPTVSPAGSAWVKVTLAVGEFTGGNIKVAWSDQTVPPEWADGYICIPPTA